MIRLLTVTLARDEDLVVARQRARQVAGALGFDLQRQTRLATAVSEIARNATRYASGGVLEFLLEDDGSALVVRVSDRGPGIPHLQAVLDGSYRSTTGMGLGIVGARRMVDEFEVQSRPGAGTTVVMRERVPRRAVGTTEAHRIAGNLARQAPRTATDEVQEQNRELLRALEELRQRQEDLTRLTAELQDTNRGVLALYAELDEKAEHLRHADEMKSRFLSNMTHEFQTPLSSILALTRLLLERADGDLTPEQEKQVRYIRQATEALSELVHDLLDLAKVEAGKVTMRVTSFTVDSLFGTLRGLMRPLQTSDMVALIFEPWDLDVPLHTDDGKLAQILRNYISNAFKFTERGEIRVSATRLDDGRIRFDVTDTGIGIPEADQHRLFREFGQVPNRLQARVRGTGLGLSLSKRLAELLGGTVGVQSRPEHGSTFWVSVPMVAPGFEPVLAEPPAAIRQGAPIALVIDDEPAARYVLRRCLASAGCRVIEAEGGESGLARAIEERPDVIFLDLRMPDMLGTEVLARLKRDAATSPIPVVIATSQPLSDTERERLGAHAVAVLAKSAIGGDDGTEQIRRALQAAHVPV